MTITLLAIIITSGILFYLCHKQNRERQTEIEESILTKMSELAEKLLLDHEKDAMRTTITHSNLDFLQSSIENNMTRILQADFDTSLRELALMKEITTALELIPNYEASDDIQVAMLSTAMRIQELKALLDDRFTKGRKTGEQDIVEPLIIEGVQLEG